jgi:hypothetical protein
MATGSQIPFNPQGKTVVVAAAAVAPSGVQAPVDQRFSAQETGQVRVVNASTNLVHIGVGPTAAAAQANAVAATAGNPAAGIPLVAGAVEVLRFPAGWYFSGAASGATTVYLTPGEGL